MGLQQVIAPATDPITLGEARQHCRITMVEDDGLLVGYLIAARTHVETHLRRALITQTWDFTIDHDWPQERRAGVLRDQIVLPKAPLQSVTSISYVDTAGNVQVLAANQYLVDATGLQGRIDPAYGVTWPTVREQLAAITVRIVCGYGSNPGDVPESIRQAMLLLIGHWYENREAVNVGNIVSEMPMAVEALLFPHRVFY